MTVKILTALLGLFGILSIICGIHLIRYQRARNARLAHFMYSLTHDSLSNPIQTAQAVADNLEKDLSLSENSYENLPRSIDDLKASLATLSGTAHNLRQLALLEVEQRAVVNEKINLVSIVQHLVLALGPEAEGQGVALMFEGKSKAITLLQQPDYIRSILTNTLHNAIKYTAGQKDARVVISVAAQPGHAIVVISDNGRGITESQLNTLAAQPQRPVAGNIDKAGSGLGLYLVRRLIDECGGKLNIQSELDRGTIVTISLPLAELP